MKAIGIALSLGVTLGLAHAADPAFGTVQYGHNKHFQTGVFFPELLAVLPQEGAEPFLVFSGLGCTECDMNTSIYIWTPAAGAMPQGEYAKAWSYPGAYIDYSTKKTEERVRTFTGQCTADTNRGVVWVTHSLKQDGKWAWSNLIVTLVGGALTERSDGDPSTTLKTAQAAVTRGKCHEITGKKFWSE